MTPLMTLLASILITLIIREYVKHMVKFPKIGETSLVIVDETQETQLSQTEMDEILQKTDHLIYRTLWEIAENEKRIRNQKRNNRISKNRQDKQIFSELSQAWENRHNQ